VKDNLNIIKNSTNSESEEDGLYNEFIGVGQSSRSSTPPPSIYFFADNEKTPKKAKSEKKSSVKKRKLK
jgi:hypothetical protein